MSHQVQLSPAASHRPTAVLDPAGHAAEPPAAAADVRTPPAGQNTCRILPTLGDPTCTRIFHTSAKDPGQARGPAGAVLRWADRGSPETGAVTSPRSSSVFAGFRFPREVIAVAVRWYLRYGLSYRDVEKLLAERGVAVDHVTVYRWVQRFTPEFIEAARFCRHAPGDRWFADET